MVCRCLLRSYYLNWWWSIINWILWNKFLWNVHKGHTNFQINCLKMPFAWWRPFFLDLGLLNNHVYDNTLVMNYVVQKLSDRLRDIHFSAVVFIKDTQKGRYLTHLDRDKQRPLYCRRHHQILFFFYEIWLLLIRILLKFLPRIPLHIRLALVLILVWHRTNTLSETMIDSVLTHIFVTWPRRVKTKFVKHFFSAKLFSNLVYFRLSIYISTNHFSHSIQQHLKTQQMLLYPVDMESH